MRRKPKPAKHHIGNQKLAALFTRRQFQALYEHHHSDVVAYRVWHGRLRIICGEYDRFLPTVLPNTRRNLRNGADGIVILAPDEAKRAAYRRKLKRDLPRSLWTRVGIITYANCSALLAREAPAAAANGNQTFEDSTT